uniref:Exported protein n=1 Tax=Ascaris lumbricoides TaxID=6252 RepID=A0A0M3I4T8_ASCLU
MSFVTLILAFLVAILLYLLLKSSGPAKSTDEKKKTSGRELTTEKKSLEEAERRRAWKKYDVEHSEAANASYHNAPSARTTTSEESEKSEFAVRQTQHSESVLTYDVHPIKAELQRLEPCQTQITYSQDAQTKYDTTIFSDMTDQNRWFNGREFR